MNEEVVLPVSAGPISAPPGFGSEVVTLETSFGDVPPDYRFLVFCITLVIALIVALYCVWRWIRNRHSVCICARCRIILTVTSVTLLSYSAICFLLSMAEITNGLRGTGSGASHMRMFAYSQAMQFFGFGFAGFTFTGLLALLMSLFEPRAPAPPEDPASRT